MRTNTEKKTALPWTLSALLVSIFLSSLDQTIVSTALPSIVAKLGRLDMISWVFTIYMLSSTAVMPIVGKLSDLYGRKIFYLSGLSLFIIGSALSGASHNMMELIIFRGIQGLGAGALMPITFTLLFTLMPQEKAGKYQAMFMGVFALSSVIGPSLGAFITEHFSWRWNFYINFPLGVFSFIVLSLSLVESKINQTKKYIDFVGAILLVLSTTSILLALKTGGTTWSWSSWQVISMFTAAAIGLVLFVRTELKVKEPMLPFDLFRNRTITGSLLATFIQGVVMFASLLYIPILVQGSRGGSAGDAGSALTPMMFSVMIGATISSILMRKLSWRGNTLLSMMIMSIGVVLLIALPLDAAKWSLLSVMAILGTGIGLLMPIAQTAVTVSADVKHQGIATSTVTFFRNIGGVFGSAIVATLVNRHLGGDLLKETSKLGLSADQAAQLKNPQVILSASHHLPPAIAQFLQQALANAIHYGFSMLLFMALAGVIVSLFMGKARFNLEEQKRRSLSSDMVE